MEHGQPSEQRDSSTDQRFFEEWEEEEFEFKAITKGLGFHEQKKDEVRQNSFPKNPSPKKSSFPQSAPSSQRVTKTLGDRAYQNDLAPFYKSAAGEVAAQTPRREEASMSSQRPVSSSSEKLSPAWGRRLIAWTIDFVLVLALSASVIAGIIVATLGPLEQYAVLLGLPEAPFFCLLVVSFFYLFYFSILERIGPTLGQKLCSLRVIAADQKVSIVDFFVRSLLSLFFVATLGLMCLFEFHEKASATKIVEE